MAYVSFRMPGKNRIFAYISQIKPINIMERYQNKFSTNVVSDGEYATFILGGTFTDQVKESYVDENNCLHTKWIEKEIVIPTQPHADPVDVDVPAEYFAKEPPQWEKDWVLWLLKDKGIDQCAFRKRRFFAYLPFLQPLIFVLSLSIKLVFTLISLLFGLRGFSLKYLLHPLTYDLSDMHSSQHSHGICDGGSIFVRPEPERFSHELKTGREIVEYLIVRFWSLPFMPAIFVPLSLIIYYHKFAILLGGLGALFTLIFIIILGVTGALAALVNLIADKFVAVTNIGGTNEIEDLICTGDPTRKPKKRSLKLRYMALKSQVCKPFAG